MAQARKAGPITRDMFQHDTGGSRSLSRPAPGRPIMIMGSMRDKIDEFLSYLEIECGLSRNTILSYGRDLRDFKGPLTRPAIQDFMAAQMSGKRRRASSIARASAALRSFLKFLGHEDLAQFVLAPKKPHLLPHPLDAGQVKDLIETDTQDRLSSRDRALLELLYACGLRVSEISMLKLNDLNLDAGYLRCFG